MYSPQEVYQMLDISPSTLRRWALEFESHLSPAAHKKHREYSERDLSLFIRIRDLSAASVKIADIKTQLDQVVDIPSEPTHTSALTLPGLLRRLDDQAAQQQQAIDQLAALQARLEALEAQIADHNNLPWWKRIRPK